MLIKRLNLRNVAAIVACLTVTTIFWGCDNKNVLDEDEPRTFGNYFNPANCTWMSQLSDDISLANLSIPGTHDSGTEKLSAGRMNTQNFSIERQLNDGIRFLDIRLRNKGNNLQVYHGNRNCDVSFDEVLNWCKAFLTAYPGEVILMSIKNEENDDILMNIWRYFEDANWKGLFYTGMASLCEDSMPALGDVRGKIVVFKRFPYAGAIPSFVNWYSKWDDANVGSSTFNFKILNKSDYTCYVEDEFQEYDTHKKRTAVENHLTAANTGNKKDFYMTYVSIAGHYSPAQASDHTPYQYAWGGNGVNPVMNTSVINFLSENSGLKRWGVIMLDFYNKHGESGENDLVELIINSNF